MHELLYLTKGEHRMDAIKDKMLRKFGYWVGTILDDQPWFDQTCEQRSCPDVVRSYGNTDRLAAGVPKPFCSAHRRRRRDQEVQGLGVERREEVAKKGTTGTQMEAVPRTDVVSLGAQKYFV